jgi:hypothetical protein
MRGLASPGPIARLALAALLGGTLVAASPTADSPLHTEFRGSCYCRAHGQLHCTGGLTLSACQRRCDEELCDEWFWKERLPCWNWGYGG